MLMFDTLKLVERLQAGGFTPEQARTFSVVLAETAGGWFAEQQLALRADLIPKADKSDVQEAKAELKAELRDETHKLEVKIIDLKFDLIRWVVGMGFAQIGLMFALLKFFAHAG